MDPLRPDPESPIGLVLSGGGARGAFQVGVYEVLSEHPSGLRGRLGAVSGTSAGAMNAALIAMGRTPRQMLDFWLDLAERPPMVVNRRLIASAQRAIAGLAAAEPLRGPRQRLREIRMAARVAARHPLLTSSGRLAAALAWVLTGRFDTVSRFLDRVEAPFLIDTSGLQDRLAAALGGPRFSPRIPLAVNAVDVRTGEVVRFVDRPVRVHGGPDASHYRVRPEMSVEMVAASAAIPLAFNPVMVEGVPMWDGGLLVNTPLAPVVALGARRLVTVLVNAGPNATDPEVPHNLGAAIERLADTYLEHAYHLDRKLLLDRNALAREWAERGRSPSPGGSLEIVELFEALRPQPQTVFNAGSYVYFEPGVMRRMYEAGKQSALAWLSRGPLREHGW